MKETRARQYLRLSDARGGNSISEQDAENTEAANEQGFTLGAAYVDPDRSASTYATKKRDDFDQLVLDLEKGDFGAEVLMLWESSRGSRNSLEWHRFLDLCQAAHVKIWITTHARLYDMNRWSDKGVLLNEGIKNEGASHETSLRTLRTAASEAKAGRPHGRCPYGYLPRYNAKGKLETWVEDPIRSIVIRELFRLLASGHSLKGIEVKFAKRGYTNASGKPFSRMHLRDLAMRIAYIGKRHHNGTTHDGVWDGLVSEERFYTVQRILTDPSRLTTRSGRAVHELTGALRCGVCDGGIMVFTATTYKCRKGHVTIQKDWVDDYVIPLMLAYLGRPDVYEALTAKSADNPEVQKVRAELVKARANRDENEAAARTAKGSTEIRLLAQAIDNLSAEITELEERERSLTLPPALAAILGARDSIREAWWRAPVSACREIANTVLTPELFGQPLIMPNPVPGTGAPAKERIAWRTKD
jgi:DNA invertase Pin-like site-specific DNA recombinase